MAKKRVRKGSARRLRGLPQDLASGERQVPMKQRVLRAERFRQRRPLDEQGPEVGEQDRSVVGADGVEGLHPQLGPGEGLAQKGLGPALPPSASLSHEREHTLGQGRARTQRIRHPEETIRRRRPRVQQRLDQRASHQSPGDVDRGGPPPDRRLEETAPQDRQQLQVACAILDRRANPHGPRGRIGGKDIRVRIGGRFSVGRHQHRLSCLVTNSRPRQGLFAFRSGELFVHFQDTPEFDHVEWFERIGLPSHGPAYDAILRGKVAYDADLERYRLGFYGTAYLSELRFNKLVETFGLDPAQVVEKRLLDAV